MRKEFERILFLMYSRTQNSILHVFEQLFGEVPKLAEGTPLERVQVVNSGARVQIPPSPRAKPPETGDSFTGFRRLFCGRGTENVTEY